MNDMFDNYENDDVDAVFSNLEQWQAHTRLNEFARTLVELDTMTEYIPVQWEWNPLR